MAHPDPRVTPLTALQTRGARLAAGTWGQSQGQSPHETAPIGSVLGSGAPPRASRAMRSGRSDEFARDSVVGT